MYSVDTNAFLTRREFRLDKKKKQLEREKEHIDSIIEHLKIEIDGIVEDKVVAGDLCDYLGQIERYFYDNGGCFTVEQIDKLLKINERYNMLRYYRSMKLEKIKKAKEELHSLLDAYIQRNEACEKKQLRRLHQRALIDKNVISDFESTLTRTLQIPTNTLTMDLMTIEVYYEECAQELINNGFEYDGEKYIFFSASAGQIRTKRTVFIREEAFKEHEQTLMCGLTIDSINAAGGVNVNKFLAYFALSNSATDEWKSFDIDRCIVIPDFASIVHGTVDHVDDETYTVARKEMDIEIEHTDGCGMMLPSVSKKNFMIRMPWVKGLLAVFDFRRFIEEYGCEPVIKDIYGQEHDLIKEDIRIILTKSQFKMWKYYFDWDEYKDKFKKYHCQAGTCKEEEDHIKNAQINYQMLQTLTDITHDELLEIAKPAVRRIDNATKSIAGMLDIMRATKENKHRSPLEEALMICPELLTDNHCKETITELKRKLVNEYRAGRLPVRGKYTFIVPDLYAACQYWFLHDENPAGLLNDGEICCHLYPENEKLDCLRAPHLYREHAVRRNVIDVETADWFRTDAVYTSCHDFISRILQFDVDGDTALVVADKTFIKVAERNMKDVVPLYYEMKKAEPDIIDRSKFYDGMKLAWAGGKIGEPSNNITKIWNENNVGKEEELAVKLLCLEVNFTIDYAKTLYKPTRPEWVPKFLGQYTNKKVPYFFQEAKGKTRAQVSPPTDSLVNQLRDIIKNKRISYHNLAPFDYTLLMFDKEVAYCQPELAAKYDELAGKYHFKLAHTYEDENDNLRYIIERCREELGALNIPVNTMVDQLTYYLFNKRSKKSLYWSCFGDIVLENLKNNIDLSTRCCKKCGRRFTYTNNRHRYCDECAAEYRRERERKKKRRQRKMAKVSPL